MSASKAYNIAGLKTSFMIIQDAALRERVNHARCGMVDSVNPLGMEATRVAYSEGAPWLAELKTYLQANRDWLVAAVRSRLPGVTLNVPQGTYLAWLDCSALDLDNPQQFFLEQAKVGLSAGLDFGDQHQQFVRLNFGCPRSLARRRHPPHGASPDPAQYLKTPPPWDVAGCDLLILFKTKVKDRSLRQLLQGVCVCCWCAAQIRSNSRQTVRVNRPYPP
jgi:hypothetical protein